MPDKPAETSLPDSVRRALRTFLQAFVGILVTSGALSAITTEGVVDWAVLKKAAISAFAAGVVAVLTYVQNAAEDRGVIPAVLKANASDGANPITKDDVT